MGTLSVSVSAESAELPRDHRVAQLAASQRGVVTRGQLVSLGLEEDTIDDRLESGLLHRVAAAVYAVGHPRIGRAGLASAALLQTGDGSALSHNSAARLWE